MPNRVVVPMPVKRSWIAAQIAFSVLLILVAAGDHAAVASSKVRLTGFERPRGDVIPWLVTVDFIEAEPIFGGQRASCWVQTRGSANTRQPTALKPRFNGAARAATVASESVGIVAALASDDQSVTTCRLTDAR